MTRTRLAATPEQRVAEYLPAARAHARSATWLRRTLGDAEVLAACEDGLMEAARDFDETRLVPFWSFARLVIRRRLSKAVRSFDRFRPLTIAPLAVPEESTEDVETLEDHAVPGAIRAEARTVLADAVAFLGALHAHTEPLGEDALVDALVARRASDAFEGAIRGLPPPEQAALRERLVDGSTWDELASRHGVSQSTLKRRLVVIREEVRGSFLATLTERVG